MTLKAGVIGLGVGEAHVVGYQAIPGVEVTTICDVDPDRLAEIGDRYDIPKRQTDWRKITRDPDLDILSICTYDDGHSVQGVEAFRNGKHCMIEKPVALHRHEAEKLLAAQQESGKQLSSNLVLRNSPRFIELKDQISAGVFGDLAYMEGDYLHSIATKITDGWRGGLEFYCVVYGGGIHLIDLMRWLSGHEVAEVSGMSNKVYTTGTKFRFDDLYTNLLRFESGTIAKTTTALCPKRRKFHALNIYGTKRTFVNGQPDAEYFDGDGETSHHTVSTPYSATMAKHGLLSDFVAAINNDREPPVSTRDVFRVMDVCFACHESAASGQSQPVTYLI